MAPKKPVTTGSGLAQPDAVGGSSSDYVVKDASAGKLQNKRVPSSTISIERPDYGTTQVIANAVYQKLMGRDARPSEIESYHAKYTAYALAHPNSTGSGNSVVDSSGAVVRNQNTSVSGGINEQDFIMNLASGKAEASAYTQATTYMDAMRSAISEFGGNF